MFEFVDGPALLTTAPQSCHQHYHTLRLLRSRPPCIRSAFPQAPDPFYQSCSLGRPSPTTYTPCMPPFLVPLHTPPPTLSNVSNHCLSGCCGRQQVNFPRTARVRKRWLMRRVFELACFTGLLLFLANQYLEPAVSNAMKPISQSDWIRVIERVLKLALPNLYAWLVSEWGWGPSKGERGLRRGVQAVHVCRREGRETLDPAPSPLTCTHAQRATPNCVVVGADGRELLGVLGIARASGNGIFRQVCNHQSGCVWLCCSRSVLPCALRCCLACTALPLYRSACSTASSTCTSTSLGR